jgi:hypothetical protein
MYSFLIGILTDQSSQGNCFFERHHLKRAQKISVIHNLDIKTLNFGANSSKGRNMINVNIDHIR